jgi:hypothetical protein
LKPDDLLAVMTAAIYAGLLAQRAPTDPLYPADYFKRLRTLARWEAKAILEELPHSG